jgi:hypothetical protein
MKQRILTIPLKEGEKIPASILVAASRIAGAVADTVSRIEIHDEDGRAYTLVRPKEAAQ